MFILDTDRIRFHAQGIRIGTQDLRIAAIALSQNVTLVTCNGRDFATIPSLNMQDWSLLDVHFVSLTPRERHARASGHPVPMRLPPGFPRSRE